MIATADLHIDLDVLIHEPEDVYHAQSSEHLGSHGLADFRKSPLLYWKDCLGLIEKPGQPLRRCGGLGRAVESLEQLAANPARPTSQQVIEQPSHSVWETK